jgi:transcriptional regulator with XRE-family HTH domain
MTTIAKKGRPIQKPTDPILGTLDDIREKKGMSRAQLAEACDVPSEALSRTMRGVHAPTLTTIYKMCEVLGVSIQISDAPTPVSPE